MLKAIFDPSKPPQWNTIQWRNIEEKIARLQYRISKANVKGDRRTVRDLQRLLVLSLSSHLKVLREVGTKENEKEIIQKLNLKLETGTKSKNFPKQIQNKIHPTSRKFKLSHHFKDSSSLKQEEILKKLWDLALLPIVEDFTLKTSKPTKIKSLKKTIQTYVQSRLNNRAISHVAYIEGNKLSSTINHDWIVKHTPMEKSLLRAWLENGRLLKKSRETNKSKTHCALTSTLTKHILNLAENFLINRINYADGHQISKTIINYDGKLLVFGETKTDLELIVKKALKLFGVNETKQSLFLIAPTSQGFNVLDWNFHKLKAKITMSVSKENLKKHKENLKTLIKLNPGKNVIIQKLTRVMTDWSTHHNGSFRLQRKVSGLNKYVLTHLWQWTRRKHPSKEKIWTLHTHWKRFKTNGVSQN